MISSRLFLADEFICTGADPYLLEWLDAYSKGRVESLVLSTGSSFQREVMLAMQQIPFGQTISYKNLALSSGHPKAMRAVGSACKRNPFPLFVPCHRVIRSDGTLGGFASDLEIKRRLIEFEAGIILPR